MSQERFWQLLSRQMANEATIQELQELEMLLQQNPEWKQLAAQLNHTDAATEEAAAVHAEAALAAHLLKMKLGGHLPGADNNRPAAKTKKSSYAGIVVLLAAGLVIAATSAYWYRQHQGTALAATNEVTTKKGSTSKIKLPDGTMVWLNADSRMTYDENFTGHAREVRLSGEAYFDVTHDANKPFIIHTDKMDIRVLGTAFNVKCYQQDATEEAALIQGKIEVSFKDRPSEKIILKENEKLVVRKDQLSIVKSAPKIELNNVQVLPDSLVAETAWLQNKLVFSGETLEHIAQMVERRFNVKVHFADEETKQYSYTAVFENETLDKILHDMSVLKKFSYKISGNEVTISK